MPEHLQTDAKSLADQVKELAGEVTEERAQRAKTRAEHAEREATIDAWLSRERAVVAALIVALPVLVTLLVMTVEGESLVELLTPGPSPALSLVQAQGALDSVIARIEGFRSDYSKLPRNLAEVGVPPHGEWTYTKTSGNHYRVVLRMYGQVLTFESSQLKVAPERRRP
jgi:hypothetical protein